MMSSAARLSLKIPVKTFRFCFSDEQFIEYQEFRRSCFDLNVTLQLFATALCFYIGRSNTLHSLGHGLNFRLSLVATIISFLLYCIFLLAYYVKYIVSEKNNEYRKLTFFIMSSPWLGDAYVDSIGILCTLGIGIGLIGRVRNGQCLNNVTTWNSQTCNPSTNLSLPLDHVVQLLILPLILQSMLSEMTFRGTLACWLISFISIIESIFLVQGTIDKRCISIFSVILVIVFKFEKIARLTFIHNLKDFEGEMEKLKLIELQQQTEHELLLEKN